MFLKILRWFWLKSVSLERRLFLLNEYFLICRKGETFPSRLLLHILKSPSFFEDYINFKRFISFNDRTLLIDVGANTGYWMKNFLYFFPSSKVIGIEPERINFTKLEKQFLNHNNVELHNYAASNYNGSNLLMIKEDGTLNSFEKYDEKFSLSRKDKIIGHQNVLVKKLDSIIKEKNFLEIDKVILKIDVQGHEVEVFEGSINTLNFVDIVICELSFASEYNQKEPSFSKITSILERYGLYPIIFQEYGKELSNHIIESDVIYVRDKFFKNIYD